MEEHGKEPRPIARKPRVVAREAADLHGEPGTETDEFNYFAFSQADRLSEVKKKIEEREKVHFELLLLRESLDGNPEPGEHNDKRTVGPEKMPMPCQCGRCELDRVVKLITSTEYAIRKMRALYARLQ